MLIISGSFYVYLNSAKESLETKYLENFFEEVMLTTSKVYFLGKGNSITINSRISTTITNISIHKKPTFDYLNLTIIKNGKEQSLLFEANEPFIRFNCTLNCSHNLITNISSYNNLQHFSNGNLKIKATSKGSWVSIDIVE